MAFDKTEPVAGSYPNSAPIRENFNQLAKHHVGAAAPPSPDLGYVWLDTAVVDNWKVKLYSQDGANPAAWVTLFENAQANPNAILAFTQLADAPASYVDQGGKMVVVKSAEDGLEFVIVPTETFAFTFQNFGAVLNTGVQDAAYLQVPFNCEIKNVRMYGGPSGSVVVDLWKDTYANYPPDIADSIVASAPPTISGGVKSEDVVLTGWTKSLSEGEGILPNVDSVANMTWVKVVLFAERR